MKQSHQQGGFTLLEIMLVVMIIAILVGGAIVMFAPNLNFAGETKAKGDIQTMSTQLMLYNARNGNFPTTEQGLRALIQMPTTDPIPRNWGGASFSDLPIDPWNQPYQYQCPGVHNPDSFDLYSSGADKKPNTADDIGNWRKTP